MSFSSSSNPKRARMSSGGGEGSSGSGGGGGDKEWDSDRKSEFAAWVALNQKKKKKAVHGNESDSSSSPERDDDNDSSAESLGWDGIVPLSPSPPHAVGGGDALHESSSSDEVENGNGGDQAESSDEVEIGNNGEDQVDHGEDPAALLDEVPAAPEEEPQAEADAGVAAADADDDGNDAASASTGSDGDGDDNEMFPDNISSSSDDSSSHDDDDDDPPPPHGDLTGQLVYGVVQHGHVGGAGGIVLVRVLPVAAVHRNYLVIRAPAEGIFRDHEFVGEVPAEYSTVTMPTGEVRFLPDRQGLPTLALMPPGMVLPPHFPAAGPGVVLPWLPLN
jgi:hypothetical protein